MIVGMGHDGTVRNWTTGRVGHVVATTELSRVESMYVTPPIVIQPNEPGSPYVQDIDYSWAHDGESDRWLMFLNRTNEIGRVNVLTTITWPHRMPHSSCKS